MRTFHRSSVRRNTLSRMTSWREVVPVSRSRSNCSPIKRWTIVGVCNPAAVMPSEFIYDGGWCKCVLSWHGEQKSVATEGERGRERKSLSSSSFCVVLCCDLIDDCRTCEPRGAAATVATRPQFMMDDAPWNRGVAADSSRTIRQLPRRRPRATHVFSSPLTLRLYVVARRGEGKCQSSCHQKRVKG